MDKKFISKAKIPQNTRDDKRSCIWNILDILYIANMATVITMAVIKKKIK